MSSQPATQTTNDDNTNVVLSHTALRNAIGVSGILLPIVLLCCTWFRGFRMQVSISNYFYTDCGDIMIVIVCILSAFLLTYYGYNWKERLCTAVAAVCGFGLAFFPTECKEPKWSNSIHIQIPDPYIAPIINIEWHLVFASTFFIAISIMCLIFFVKTNETKQMTKQKKIRNIVYRVCGWAMIGCVIYLAVYFIWGKEESEPTTPVVFWCEAVALWFFGIAWITKGGLLFRD